MIAVGLTGGIASGKSLVAKKLKELGATLIDADEVAREILRPGQPAFEEVARAFGKAVLTNDGEINRKKLGAIIFSDGKKRAELNRLTHPRIRARMTERVEELRKTSQTRLVILDIPLLIEAGLEASVDYVIVVYADVEQQLLRLMERDALTREEAQARLDAQMPLKEKLKSADFIIDNNSTPAETLRQTERIFERIMASVNNKDKG